MTPSSKALNARWELSLDLILHKADGDRLARIAARSMLRLGSADCNTGYVIAKVPFFLGCLRPLSPNSYHQR
jgi:hypothetical protein